MSKPLTEFLKYRFPAIGWALLIFVASSVPGVRLPRLVFVSTDKVVHFGVFFVFEILVLRALYADGRGGHYWWRFLAGILLVLGYAALDEYHQGFVAGRTKDIMDFLADSVGAVLAGIFWHFWPRKRRNSAGIAPRP